VTGVAGDGTLHLRVKAPPADGLANRACVELLAGALGVNRAAVVLAGGATFRDKRFRVTGLTREGLRERLAVLPRLPPPAEP
jgi:hypothetical protein